MARYYWYINDIRSVGRWLFLAVNVHVKWYKGETSLGIPHIGMPKSSTCKHWLYSLRKEQNHCKKVLPTSNPVSGLGSKVPAKPSKTWMVACSPFIAYHTSLKAANVASIQHHSLNCIKGQNNNPVLPEPSTLFTIFPNLEVGQKIIAVQYIQAFNWRKRLG